MAKDFSKITDAIEKGNNTRGSQTPATKEEAAKRAEELRTQGRKGCRAERINIAITPENHRYLRVMARITGRSMTEFTNIVIEQHRTEHPELYATAQSIIEESKR